MQAIVISQYGGPERLVLTDIPTPVPENGEVLIKVKAFGINRAETEMRKGTWFEIARVSGIECVGQVEYDPSGALVWQESLGGSQPGQVTLKKCQGQSAPPQGDRRSKDIQPLLDASARATRGWRSHAE